MNMSRGFTLIETMIVLAIMSILFAIAQPDFAKMISARQTRAVADELYADVYWAREEAIKRKEGVAVTLGAGGWAVTTTNGALLKTYASKYAKVQVTGSDFTFDGIRGLTAGSVVTVGGANAGSVSMNVLALGFADICSNDIGGFGKC
jgi:prepilin-type N-terminal cleavage/methylation domain-containing protein